MLFAHAGHAHSSEMCCSTITIVVAGLALAVATAALIIALRKNKKK